MIGSRNNKPSTIAYSLTSLKVQVLFLSVLSPENKESLPAWLTAVVLLRDDFQLPATEFRDALCLRYMKLLFQLSPYYDRCGSIFITSHALDCLKGGLVIHCHHKIRDLMFDLSSLVWTQAVKEPVVKNGNASNPHSEALVVDLGAKGVW